MKIGDRVQYQAGETRGIVFEAAVARGLITKIVNGVATVDWKLPRGIVVPDSVSREADVDKLEIVKS